MRNGLLQMSCQNSGSNTGRLSGELGVALDRHCLVPVLERSGRDGLTVTNVGKRELELGNAGLAWRVFHVCLLEK